MAQQGVSSDTRRIDFAGGDANLKNKYLHPCTPIRNASSKPTLHPGHTYRKNLPDEGFKDPELWKEIDHYGSLNDVNWQNGRCSGTIYCAQNDNNELLSEVSFTTF